MPKAHCLGDAMADALKSRAQITLTTGRNPEEFRLRRRPIVMQWDIEEDFFFI